MCVLQRTRKDDLENNRAAFFKDVQGAKDVNPSTFQAYCRAAQKQPGNGVESGKIGKTPSLDAFKM
jgi:hypothetical protein